MNIKEKILNIVTEKRLYEVLSLIYVTLLYITLFKLIDGGFKFFYLVLFIPMAILILISLIMTPILLGKELTKLRELLGMFYAFVSFWLLANIISFIFILRVI